jgi:hypothetical protein
VVVLAHLAKRDSLTTAASGLKFSAESYLQDRQAGQ